MNSMEFNLTRYLNAKYPGHIRTDNQFRQEWAAAIAAKAFPEWRRTLEYFFIRSPRRLCAKFEVAGRGGIIMDDGLSNLLAVGDLLLLDPSDEGGGGDAFVSYQFAEAFYQEADAERMIVAAAAAMRHSGHLSSWRHRVSSSPGHSAVMLFLLLHEIGHFAVDNRVSFVAHHIENVRRMLRSLIEENEKVAARLISGEALANVDASFGRGPSIERDALMDQISSYADLIREDEELVREASCDVVALAGLVELRIALSTIDSSRTISRVTYRKFADTLFIALRTSRLLVAQEMIRNSAEAIVSGADPSKLNRSFARLTARFNIVTNLAREFFSVVGTFRFNTAFHQDDPGKDTDPARLFDGGIRIIHDRSVKRIFDPIDRLNGFFRDPTSFRQHATELMQRQFDNKSPSVDELEQLAQRLMNGPPI